MRIAVLSDVHANLPALEAVRADIADHDVAATYVLGDLVGYAPWPNEVIDALRADGVQALTGNYDDGTGFDRDECGCSYINPREKALGDESFEWTKAHVTPANKEWLRAMSPQIRFDADGQRYLLVHGSPRRINEYLYEDRSDETFARIAAQSNADVIVCGHTHRPYDKFVAGTRFINVGSAGKPKDGDPRACWALIDTTARTTKFRRVTYDVERAAEGILSAHLPALFARELREARGYDALLDESQSIADAVS
jgi:putative phosphoesterase